MCILRGTCPTALGKVPENSLKLHYYDESKGRWWPMKAILNKNRHEFAVVINKLYDKYALIGGYGLTGELPSVAGSQTSYSEPVVEKETAPAAEEKPITTPVPSLLIEKPKESGLLRFLKKIFPFFR